MRRFRRLHAVPHMLTAGVYTALDDYVDGLERFREQVGRTANTADGIFVLPYAGVTQSLAPVAEVADTAQTCGVRSEHVKRGHAYSRRPRRTRCSANPCLPTFGATVMITVRVVRVCGVQPASGLSSGDWTVPTCPRAAWQPLREHAFEDGDSLVRPAAAYYADALLMIACMFPETHQINKPMIPEFLAVGIPALQRALRSSADDGDVEGPSLNLRALVDDDLCAAGRAFVAKLRRAWADIAPLLELLDELDGRHDLSRAKRTDSPGIRACRSRLLLPARRHRRDSVRQPGAWCDAPRKSGAWPSTPSSSGLRRSARRRAAASSE